MGISFWGVIILVSEVIFVVLALIGFSTGKLVWAWWGMGQLAVIFMIGAWFSRKADKNREKKQ